MQPLHNIPIELVRSFVAVADIKSFSRAAERLRLSQPAISQHLRRLGRLLGVELLHAPGVNLTDDAYAILPSAREILALNDEILHLSGAGPRTSMRFGVSIGYMDLLVPHYHELCDLLGSDIHLVQDDTGRLLDHMPDGEYDAVIGLSDRPSGAVVTWDEPLFWMKASTLDLSSNRLIRLLDVRHAALTRATHRALLSSGRAFETILTVPDIATQINAVGRGMGIAATIRCVAPAELLAPADEKLPVLPSLKGGLWISERLPETIASRLAEAIWRCVAA